MLIVIMLESVEIILAKFTLSEDGDNVHVYSR